MKHSEEIPAEAKGNSPLPRFLRGLFHRRQAQPPAAASEAVPEIRAASASADIARTRPVVQPVDGQRPKILVVDDDPVILKTVGITLTKAGFEVVTGHDGSEAVAIARKNHPDVIILDINFPPEVALAWDGIGVMQWLQRLENGEAPPVIIITALSNGQIREKALAAGAVAFFPKPIDNDGLIAAIDKVLALRRADGKSTKQMDFTI